jgi:hypothetical protein
MYLDDRLLPLDASGYRGLLDVDGEVAAFEVARDAEGDVEITDGLSPFVR